MRAWTVAVLPLAMMLTACDGQEEDEQAAGDSIDQALYEEYCVEAGMVASSIQAGDFEAAETEAADLARTGVRLGGVEQRDSQTVRNDFIPPSDMMEFQREEAWEESAEALTRILDRCVEAGLYDYGLRPLGVQDHSA